MLETFRKHHKVMMIVVAAIVIVAFTFLYSPTSDTFGSGGGTVATLNGEPLTGNDMDAISRELGMAMQLSIQGDDPNSAGGGDIMTTYGGRLFNYGYGQQFHMGGIGKLVDILQPKDPRNEMDLDGPLNVALMRQECLRLGIDVEREDVEKAIKTLGAFQTNKAFDDAKLNTFLDSGRHGDRPTTETKLMTVVRDALLYQRLGDLVGGSYAPSQAEIDNTYAQQNTRTTVQTALVEKKNHENQTVTPEDAKKYYDEEKAKQDAIKPDDKEPKPGADASLLTEEKRTVKYVVTTAVKPPDAPKAPDPAPTPVPALEDVSKLPEDQKKAKEEEHKKLTDEYNTKKAAHDKLVAEHTKALEEHSKKVTEAAETKKKWLENLSNFSSALADTESRKGKSFEEVAKEFQLEAKTATFTRTTLPDDLKAAVVTPTPTPGRPPQGEAFNPADGIFASDKGHDEIAGPRDQSVFCVWVVDAIEAPTMKPLEEVQAAITEKLKTEKIAAALKAAGDDARSKILEALKTSKTFKEAATAAGLTATEVPAFSAKKPLPTETANGANIKTTADALNKGDLSDAVSVPEGLLLVYVEKKELPNDPKMAEQKKGMITGQTRKGTESDLFKAWFMTRRSAGTAVAAE